MCDSGNIASAAGLVPAAALAFAAQPALATWGRALALADGAFAFPADGVEMSVTSGVIAVNDAKAVLAKAKEHGHGIGQKVGDLAHTPSGAELEELACHRVNFNDGVKPWKRTAESMN